MKTRTSDDTEISIERARPDMPGKYATGFTRGNSTSIEHLTQGELIDLWQRIGTLFSLTAAASPEPPARRTANCLPLTPGQHCAEASRLLWVIDDQLQNDSVPRSLLDLAVIALGHAITALAADTFEDGKERP